MLLQKRAPKSRRRARMYHSVFTPHYFIYHMTYLLISEPVVRAPEYQDAKSTEVANEQAVIAGADDGGSDNDNDDVEDVLQEL